MCTGFAWSPSLLTVILEMPSKLEKHKPRKKDQDWHSLFVVGPPWCVGVCVCVCAETRIREVREREIERGPEILREKEKESGREKKRKRVEERARETETGKNDRERDKNV